MTAVLPTDTIIQQCHDKKWQYPKPVENLDEWLAENRDAFDPQLAHRLYWPDRPYQSGMEILIVDGGTTQAPVIARTNPAATVIATVHSKESMDHAIYLKHKNGLGNLELHHLPIDGIRDLNRTFDLVVASGVLQQAGYSEAQLGMNAIAEVLRPEGVAAFLLYSRYLPSNPDAGYQANAGDPLVQPSAAYFRVDDCLALVEGAGLVFQDWMVKSPYYPPTLVGSAGEFLRAMNAMPESKVWSLMEPLRNQSGCHLFTACRPHRPVESYRIDFAAPRALDYVPGWCLHAGLEGRQAVRPGWSMPLDAIQLELAQQIDARRTIREIGRQCGIEYSVTALFNELWRMDFIHVQIA